MTTKISISTAVKILNSNKDFIFYKVENERLKVENQRLIDFTLTNDISRFRARYNNKFKILADIKKQIKTNLKIEL